jgi:hypothetical protein
VVWSGNLSSSAEAPFNGVQPYVWCPQLELFDAPSNNLTSLMKEKYERQRTIRRDGKGGELFPGGEGYMGQEDCLIVSVSTPRVSLLLVAFPYWNVKCIAVQHSIKIVKLHDMLYSDPACWHWRNRQNEFASSNSFCSRRGLQCLLGLRFRGPTSSQQRCGSCYVELQVNFLLSVMSFIHFLFLDHVDVYLQL